MANQNLKENVLLNLRSVTQSCKGGVPFERLQRDYKDLLGSPIPFRDLGYDSLEGFIRDIPHVIALKKNNEGKLVALGVADSSTAHIVSLVSRQKADTKKKPFRRSPPHGGMRKTLSSRYSFREGPRGAHSRFSSSDHNSRSFPRARTPPLRSAPPRSAPPRNAPPRNAPPKSLPLKSSPPPRSSRTYPRATTPPLKSPSPTKPPPPPPVQHSKPRAPPEQVPRKYEVAPRFLKLIKKEVKTDYDVSPPELTPLPTPLSTTNSMSPVSLNNTHVIPPPRASFPVKPFLALSM